MSRILWGLGVLGAAGMLASGATGFAVKDVSDAALSRHVLLSLGATLCALFAHCWAALYLLGLERAVGATVADGGLAPAARDEARRVRRKALPWILAALGLTLLLFLLGSPTTTGTFPAPAHHALAWGALLAQGVALQRERRALGRAAALLASGAPAGRPVEA
jgi:hypothetical protein